MQKTMGAGFPFASLEEMSKNSMEMFERTMKMFSPFPEGAEPEDPKALEADRPTGDQSQNLETLKKQMDRLQAQLDALSKINSGSK
jgi:polyhydroxyalkanoate synthesis regulator protein